VTPAQRPTPPSTPPGAVPTVAWRSDAPDGLPGALDLLDQTRLPHEQVALRCEDVDTLVGAIRRLVLRGAPALGVAGAYGTVVAAQEALRVDGRYATFAALAQRVRAARPTAVNLAWAVDRCVGAARGISDPAEAQRRLLAEARAIHAEDEAACAAMGRHGAALLREGGSYLTHCNTGRLATAGIGTAFAVFATAQAWGLRPKVHVGEVRPLLQGARLTAFELRERGIDGCLLPDSAAGALLRSGRIEAVFVGADRIARNGDTANKIGTYALAELARANGVPFYVVAPSSTVDPSLADGSLIEIEARDAAEVLCFAGAPTAPAGFPVHNPAFDVTPGHLVSGVVTERGIARPPYDLSNREAGLS
jgi:methylthioribose-1-phosphate isomerase